MTIDDITEDHPVVDHHDLDVETVHRVLDKFVESGRDLSEIAEDVGDVLGIDPRDDARDLIKQYREPDWPIEYEKTFRVDDVDVYNDFDLSHDGYEPLFAGEFDPIHATWRIDKNGSGYSWTYDVTLVEVNGVRMDE